MIRLVRIYELAVLYVSIVAYFILGYYRLTYFDNNTIHYIFYEASLALLLVRLIQELIIYLRFKKYEAKPIVVYLRSTIILRLIVVISYYTLLWIVDIDYMRYLFVFLLIIINYVFPKPVSERFYVTKDGYILKSIFHEFSTIEKIELFDSGDVEIMNNDRKERIAYHSNKQKKIIYEYLQKQKQSL